MGTEKRERQKAGRAQRLEEARLAQKKAQRRRQLITAVVIVAIFLALFGISAFFSNRNKNNEVATGTTGTSGPSTTPTSGAPVQGNAPKLCIDPAKSYSATFDTTAGTIKVNLDTTRTPGTTNNFVVLSKSGYYNGTPIFRADKSIDIVQGGGKSSADPGPGYTIPDEGGKFTYQPGQLVMARTGAPNSAGAQWFFTGGPKSSNLDAQGTYVTFGQVTEGLDIVQKMLATSTEGGQMGGAPDPPVTVNKVTIDESSTPPTTMAPVPPGLPPFSYGTGECTGPTSASATPGGAATGQPGVPPAGAASTVPGAAGAVTGQPSTPASIPAVPSTPVAPAAAATGQPTSSAPAAATPTSAAAPTSAPAG